MAVHLSSQDYPNPMSYVNHPTQRINLAILRPIAQCAGTSSPEGAGTSSPEGGRTCAMQVSVGLSRNSPRPLQSALHLPCQMPPSACITAPAAAFRNRPSPLNLTDVFVPDRLSLASSRLQMPHHLKHPQPLGRYVRQRRSIEPSMHDELIPYMAVESVDHHFKAKTVFCAK